MATLLSKLKEDPTFKKGHNVLARAEKGIDPDSITMEILSLHNSRGITSLKAREVTKNSVRSMIDASLDEIGVRSRCTTIKLQCMTQQIKIDETVDHLRKYILIKYGKRMQKAGHTSLAAKKAQVDIHLQPFISFKNRLKSLDDLASLVIDDCDSTGWRLKGIEDALQRSSKDK